MKKTTTHSFSGKRILDFLQREYPDNYSASGVASALAMNVNTARRELATLARDPLLVVRYKPGSYRAVDLAPHLRQDNSDSFRAEVYGVYK